MTQESIRNLWYFSRSLRDYESWLGEAGIEATDIDVAMEKNGHFVFIEAKTGSDRFYIRQGQFILHQALATRPGMYVLFVLDRPPSGSLPNLMVRVHQLLPDELYRADGWDTSAWMTLTKRELANILREWQWTGDARGPFDTHRLTVRDFL